MNISISLLVPSTLISLLLFPLALVHASPSPADGAPACSPVDLFQGEHGRPASVVTRQADLNVGEPRTVRLIYFLPRDRQPQPFINGRLDALIKDVQQSYAEQLENHGFGRRTFKYETDAAGKAVVHHVKGKFDDAYYHTDTSGKVVWTETAEQFDLSRNVYLVVLDVSTATVDSFCGQGSPHGSEGGIALIPAPNSDRERERGWSCFNVSVAAHELGHAFGLAHDVFRDKNRSPSSYHTDRMVTSFCAAEWLDGHRYFNHGQGYPEEDGQTTIRMRPPLAVPPNAIQLHFEVADPDGLYQAQFHGNMGDAIGCRGINGDSTSIEFVTTEVTEAPDNRVSLRVVDANGNVTQEEYLIDIFELPDPEVVSIPDQNLATVVRETLGLELGDAVTQLDVLRLRHLEAVDHQIIDLTGLEHAVNLKHLDLTRNQIRDIAPLAGLTVLEALYLPDNDISDISALEEMTNVSDLNLSRCSVSDLSPLTGLDVLQSLVLTGNSVSDLSPLAGLSNLRYLDLWRNSVSDLSPLTDLNHLETLYLWGNPLSNRSITTHIPALHRRGITVSFEDLRWALDFAHFANGDSITSDLVLVNMATHPIRPALYFYDTGGNPIDPESVVDLTGDLEVTEDGALSVQTEMEPLGELTISTHSRGKLVTGSVKVVANGPIGGVLRFDLPGIGVAGVGASQPVRDALFPARRQAGGISTAAAIRNWEEEPIVVTCHLKQGGVVRDTEKIELEGDGQTARFIHELFEEIDTSNFTGSVHCTAPESKMFIGVALEMDADKRILTTLPLVPVEEAVAGGPALILDFAHFASGDSITSDLVFVNVSSTAVSPSIHFYDPEGTPIDAGSVVEVTDDLEVAESETLTIGKEINPLGELTITTTGVGELKTGSVRVVANAPIGGVLRFDLPGIGVAGVGASQPVSDAIFPARRQAGGISTAAAIHNLGEEAMVVSCRLMKAGVVLEEVEIPLEGNGQEARYIEQMFTNADTTDFVGSVRCTAPEGGLFTGVAVELDAGNRIFTTLPVVPVPERMSQE